jgi:hypothetical protein
MFERLKRRLTGKPDPETAYRQCVMCLDNLIHNLRSKMGDDSPLNSLFENEGLKHQVLAHLREATRASFEAADSREQLITLRKYIVAATDDRIAAEQYLALKSEDRGIIRDRGHASYPTTESLDPAFAG